jgi:integrase/recombinase XerD
MLTIYRRHRASCKNRARRNTKCFCPIWVQGTLEGKILRRSLDLTGWEAAQRKVRDLEIRGDAGVASVSEACDKFLADCEGRKLSAGIIKKYKYVTAELKDRFTTLRSITVDDVRTMRNSWKYSALTALKRLEYVRTFFSFCVASGWIQSNPAKGIKSPIVHANPTAPFEGDEWERILWAVDSYLEVHPESNLKSQKQLRAFILVLRYSGLRISDAVSLKRERIDKDGQLFIHAIKNQKAVRLPLPKNVVEAVESCDEGNPYPFWTGTGKLSSALGVWRVRLMRIAKIAGIKGRGFAHRCRASFSVELLNKGVPLEMVARILGNSARIVEKHYASFVQSRQVSLEEAVKRTWQSA